MFLIYFIRWLCPYQTGYSGPAQIELILSSGFSLSSNTRDQLMSFDNNKEVVGMEQIEEKIIIQFRYVSHTILMSAY